MPRLIDAKKLKREIKSLCNPYGKPSIGFQDGKLILDLIDRQPTVDAEPVRHGRWMELKAAIEEEIYSRWGTDPMYYAGSDDKTEGHDESVPAQQAGQMDRKDRGIERGCGR